MPAGTSSFLMLGAAFLAVTGGEAMYADLGHFGAPAIRAAWFALVLPALLIHYCGQGALIIADPSAIENPFYRLAPDWAHYPLVALATMATVIASQAVISGVYSLTQQSIQLGFMPMMRVVHTDEDERGQIYVPAVNWLLAAATLTAVVVFGSSDALAGAYGIAVSALMGITTLLAALIALRWGYNPILVLAVNGFFLGIDLVFFAANSVKLFEGGWFPLLLAGAVAFLMLTWMKGNHVLESVRQTMRMSEAAFLSSLSSHPPVTLPGTAAFLTAATEGIPMALGRLLERSRCLHERILLITVVYEEEPVIPASERAQVTLVAQGIRKGDLQVHAGHGARRPALRLHADRLDPGGAAMRGGERLLPPEYLEDMTYFVGHEVVIPSPTHPGMAPWREAMFAFMKRNAERTGAHFCLPTRQIVEVGTEIEI
ncbi:KUP/HAK/KT family potassium transporter [Methylobacterium oryzae CBMB20]